MVLTTPAKCVIIRIIAGTCVPAMFRNVKIIIIANLKSPFRDGISNPWSCSIALFILEKVGVTFYQAKKITNCKIKKFGQVIFSLAGNTILKRTDKSIF